jgi:outer membrane protein, heavy metal efflux system
MRVLFLLLPLLLYSAAVPSPAQTASDAALDSLVAEALAHNPRITSVREGSAAARARVGQATALEPPLVGLEFYQTPVGSFPNPIRNGRETDYSVQQNLPFPGKKDALGRVARNSADMTGQNVRALERQVAREVKTAYYTLYFAQRDREVNLRTQDFLRELIDITTRRYEVGGGKQTDILRAQTELSLLATENMRLAGNIRVAEANLNTVLGRFAGRPFGDIPAIEREMPDLNPDRLDSLAVANRPELRGMESGIRMNEAELSAAEKDKLPDFMLRFQYKDMKTEGDFWSSMVGVTVPPALWSRGGYESRIRESRINIRQARANYESERNNTLRDVHTAFETLQANRNVLNSYRSTLVPQAEQTLESTLAAYRAGTTDFPSLIDAERTLLEIQRDYQMAIANFMTSVAEVEWAAGME